MSEQRRATNEKFLAEKVDGYLSEMMAQILKKKPDDILGFMAEWVHNKQTGKRSESPAGRGGSPDARPIAQDARPPLPPSPAPKPVEQPKPASQQKERTFIMVKPDGVQRKHVGEVIRKFEDKGFKLVGMKLARPNKDQLESHYEEHRGKPFLPKLVDYMLMGPVAQMVFEGNGVIATGRKMLGKTKPLESDPRTIRGDWGVDSGRNICHGSDSIEAANREIGLWIKPEELSMWEQCNHKLIYE